MPVSRTRPLTEKRISILLSVAQFKVLRLDQLQRIHFNHGKSEHANAATAHRTLSELQRKKYLTVYKTAGLTRNNEQLTKPKNFYAFLPENQTATLRNLQATGRVQQWEKFQDFVRPFNKDKTFTPVTLDHETGISEFFIQLTHAHAKHPKRFSISYWLPTSPTHADNDLKTICELQSTKIPYTYDVWDRNSKKEITVTKEFPFNPDGVFCLHTEPENHITKQNLLFGKLEYENGSTKPQTLVDKLRAYLAYRDQKLFIPHVGHLWNKYQTTHRVSLMPNIKKQIQIFIVTKNRELRDQYFLAALELPLKNAFLFAALPDIQQDFFGRNWLVKSLISSPNTIDTYTHIKRTARPHKAFAFGQDLIQSLTPIVLLDD